MYEGSSRLQRMRICWHQIFAAPMHEAAVCKSERSLPWPMCLLLTRNSRSTVEWLRLYAEALHLIML